MIGSLISGATNLLGGFLGREAQSDANAQAARTAERNIQMQKQFAKEGIRWKVEDARQAGIHPLYALGAQTTSFAPVTAGYVPENGLAQGVANMGQDISRALTATRTGSERSTALMQTADALRVENMGLQNDLLRSQIAKNSAPQVGPSMADGVSSTADTRGLQLLEGQPIVSTPKTEAKQDDVSKEYGDEGLASVPGQIRIARDWMKSNGYPFTPGGVANAVKDGWLKWNDALARDILGYVTPKIRGR